MDLKTKLKELETQIRIKENQMLSIQQIGQSLSSELNRDRLLILIMKEVTKLMNAERGTLFIVDSEKGELWSKIAQKAEIKELLGRFLLKPFLKPILLYSLIL